MDLEVFFKENLTDSGNSPEYNQYLYLKQRLEFQQSIETAEESSAMFSEFVTLKDRMFDEAMSNWLRKRGMNEE